jgi:hypothetical protein
MHLAHALAPRFGSKTISPLPSLLILDLSNAGLGEAALRVLAPAISSHAASIQVQRVSGGSSL